MDASQGPHCGCVSARFIYACITFRWGHRGAGYWPSSSSDYREVGCRNKPSIVQVESESKSVSVNRILYWSLFSRIPVSRCRLLSWWFVPPREKEFAKKKHILALFPSRKFKTIFRGTQIPWPLILSDSECFTHGISEKIKKGTIWLFLFLRQPLYICRP